MNKKIRDQIKQIANGNHAIQDFLVQEVWKAAQKVIDDFKELEALSDRNQEFSEMESREW